MIQSIFAFVLIFLSPKSHADIATSDAHICIQSFNAFTPVYAVRKHDRLRILAEELRKDPCTIVQLQELWTPEYYQEFLGELKSDIYQAFRGDEFRNDDKITGLITFYQGKSTATHAELFEVNNVGSGADDDIRHSFGVEKGFTVFDTVVSPENPLPLRLVNLHDHPLEAAVRVSQILQVVDYLWYQVPNLDSVPLVINGDMNATPKTLELALFKDLLALREAFFDVNHKYDGFCTYCGTKNKFAALFDKTDRFIDYILFRSGVDYYIEPDSAIVNLLGTRELPLSDHYGVRAEFEYGKRTTALMANDHPVVVERIQKALTTISAALAILKKESYDGLAPSIARAEKIKAALETGTLPQAVDRLFRTF